MARPVGNDGYSRLSIVTHWITAFVVIVLFLTHEGERGDAAYAVHVGGGALAGLFLLWRVGYRVLRGFPNDPGKAAPFNLAARIVFWGFLAAIVLVILTGYLLPWSQGHPIDLFGLVSIPSPLAPSRDLHEFVEEAHEAAGQAFLPLLILHVLGAFRHVIFDKGHLAGRMRRAVLGGY